MLEQPAPDSAANGTCAVDDVAADIRVCHVCALPSHANVPTVTTHSRTAGVGSVAPDFDLPDATGTRYRLADLLTQGPVVLVFLRGFS
jgi:hypothetical protein